MNPIYTGDIQAFHRFGFLWLVPLFPLVGAAINGILGKRLQDRFGRKAVHGIAIGAMLGAAAVAVGAFAQLLALPADQRFLLDTRWEMLRIGALKVDFAFALDPLSGMMTLIITLIGTLIHVYSVGYMATEKAYWRFFCYLNLFVFSMLMLVMGDSFLLMFFGWEGVGLCSYLLIVFWYTDVEKAKAGMKAFVVNRVGDWGFITGLLLLFWGLGGVWGVGAFRAQRPETVTVDAKHGGAAMQIKHKGDRAPEASVREVGVGPTMVFRELRDQISIKDASGDKPFSQQLADKTVWGLPLLFVVCLCFFIGATGKSAQIPLYVWLPDAMAGPTPVSALIHAATMVTAGVYMIARLSFLFAMSPGAMTVVATVGVLTALLGATIGLFQYDIKKVLAYSTVSQLGFMFVGVGVGAYWIGVFHLLTHACFKACLFLGSGSVIHGMHFLEHGAHGHGDDGHGGGGGGADPHAEPAHGHVSAAAGHGHQTPGHTVHAAAGHHAPSHETPHHVEPPAPPKPDLWLAPSPTDPQDMRNMGGLARLMPKTRLTYLLACISIAGFPVAAGFYSKDEILWKAFTNENTIIPGALLWLIGFITAGCTSFYMFRSYYMTFHGRPPTDEIRRNVHESPASMTTVLLILAAAAVLIGPVLGWPHAWGGHPLLESFLRPVFAAAEPLVKFNENLHATEYLFQGLSVLIATAGCLLARTLYIDLDRTRVRLEQMRNAWTGVHRTLFNKYYVDELYREIAIIPTLDFAKGFAWIDAHIVDFAVNTAGKVGRWAAGLGGWIDRIFVDGAVNGVSKLLLSGGRRAMRLQTGRINNYVLGITVGTVVLVFVAFFAGS